jgi:hypothetical protein
MDMQKIDFNREMSRIKHSLESGTTLSEEDLKIILLSLLNEEDLHESNQ